jgi:ATP-dependent Clp protease ATP-binding subunit ClpA
MLNWLKSFWKKQSPPAVAGAPASAEPAPSFFTWAQQKLAAAQKQPGRVNHNFTPRAVQVLALAQQEARRLNLNFVGTEHVLLGLVKLGQGVAFNVLQQHGLDLESTRLEVEKYVGVGPVKTPPGVIPYTPRVKKALALSVRESKALYHAYTGTEHLLLGLLREGGGVAGKILKKHEVGRDEILKELVPNPVERRPGKDGPELITCSFTPDAERALTLARGEARRLNHNFIGTEALLLGLIDLGQGAAWNVLNKLDLDLQKIRCELYECVGPGPMLPLPGGHGYTPRVNRALALAQKEAKALKHNRIGSGHILLGLIREGDGVVAVVLKKNKINAEQTCNQILNELKLSGGDDGQNGSGDPPAQSR